MNLTPAAEVLAEDKVIERFPLGVLREDVRVVPVAEVFAKMTNPKTIAKAAAAKPSFPLKSVLIAALLGAALEVGVAEATGAKESWDTPEYAVIVLPALGLLAAVFAWRNPRRSVICGVAAVVGHFLAMVVRAEDVPSMLPIGLVLTVPIAAGVALIGLFVGRLRKEAVHDHDDEAGEHADLDQ